MSRSLASLCGQLSADHRPPGGRQDRYALEEADLDLERRRLRVERTLSDDGERVDTPKGGFSREVDLSNEAVRVLRTHLVRRREEKLQRRGAALPKPLFCSTTGGYPDPSGVREAFRRVCMKAEKKAGLTRDQAARMVASTRPALHAARPPPHLRSPPPPGRDGRLLRLPDARARRHLAHRPHLRRLAPAYRRTGVDVLDRTPAQAKAQEARA